MKIVLDLTREIWDFDLSEILKGYTPSDEVVFDFVDNGNSYVEFKDLSFGFLIKEDENILYDVSFPAENVKYISTDQDYLENYFIDGLVPEKKYVIEVWAINDNKHFSDFVSFTMPKPRQPSPSWKWDSENNFWIPPLDSAGISLIIESQTVEQ